MAALRNIISRLSRKHFVLKEQSFLSQAIQDAQGNKKEVANFKSDKLNPQLAEYRFVYPEFLPNPDFRVRHKLCEKLEREDMLKRRCVIDIPEFYVGSIMAVTTSDPFSPSKENRFVGICISRTYLGLQATFILRNVVNKQGVEIMYEMYNPGILRIEVLRLEKRLDGELFYLRDALPEYSTFAFDIEPEFSLEKQPVRLNPLKVKLKPKPWHCRWERFNLKGVEKIDLPERFFTRAKQVAKPWEDYDIMKQYRRCIPEEDQQQIWQDVDSHQPQFQIKRQQMKKKVLQKAGPKP